MNETAECPKHTGQLELLENVQRERYEDLLECIQELAVFLGAVDNGGDGLKHPQASDLLAIRFVVNHAAGRVAGELHPARSRARARLVQRLLLRLLHILYKLHESRTLEAKMQRTMMQ